MNTVTLLAIILFLLMAFIGKGKGVRSFVALFFNFAVLFFAILFMMDPSADPILLTIIAGTAISCITLFYINGINTTTITSFISTVITMVILIFFILIITDAAMIQGFSEEEFEVLYLFSMYIGVDFVKIAASVIIMATIGAIVDLTISIASPMREIQLNNPAITRKDLYLSGMSIGRDILGTSTNTLFFAFFGGYLALLIWFKDLTYSLGEIVNSKVFAESMLTILLAGIGIALAIPITAAVTAFFLVKERKKNGQSEKT